MTGRRDSRCRWPMRSARRAVRVIFPELPDAEYWGTDLNDALLSHCTRVNFGVAPHQQDIMPVGDEMLNGAEVAQRLAEHIGPQRLPFDRMWFEGSVAGHGGRLW